MSSGAASASTARRASRTRSGMSALRLEVETHIVTASATAVQNLSKCVAAAGVKIDELVVNSLASADAVLNETEKELGRRRRRHRRGHDRPRAVPGGLAVPHPGPAGRWQQRHQRRRDRAQDLAGGRRGAEDPARLGRPQGRRRGRGDQRQRPRRGGRADGQPARGLPDHRGADARDVRAAAQRDPRRPASASCRPGSS